VIILSDENVIWPELTTRLNHLGSRHGCSFVPLPPVHYSAPDDEVARICRREGAAALLTANVSDFGAKLVYYQALVNADVSVIVLRQPNPETETPDVDYQVALLQPRLRGIIRRLERTDEALLFSVNKHGVRPRRLQELIDLLSP
jgi:hypothetical protein